MGPELARETNCQILRYCPMRDRWRGLGLADDIQFQRARLEAISRERSELAEQIRNSQETIELSLELIRLVDEMLGKAEQKP
jgi:hypothetical protein